MTIDEAIKLLNNVIRIDLYDNDLDDHNAVKLGIEALKRIQEGRSPDRRYVCYLLPEETIA